MSMEEQIMSLRSAIMVAKLHAKRQDNRLPTLPEHS